MSQSHCSALWIFFSYSSPGTNLKRSRNLKNLSRNPCGRRPRHGVRLSSGCWSRGASGSYPGWCPRMLSNRNSSPVTSKTPCSMCFIIGVQIPGSWRVRTDLQHFSPKCFARLIPWNLSAWHRGHFLLISNLISPRVGQMGGWCLSRRGSHPIHTHTFNGICMPAALGRLFLMVRDYFPWYSDPILSFVKDERVVVATLQRERQGKRHNSDTFDFLFDCQFYEMKWQRMQSAFQPRRDFSYTQTISTHFW